jgi:hypothetical protein
MAGNGGTRPGAGRPKGRTNTATIKSREALWAYIDKQTAAGHNANPFQVMVDTMIRTRLVGLKIACAQALADRLLPKLKAIEHTGKDGGPMEYREIPAAQRHQRIEALLAKRNGHAVEH